MKEKSKDHLDFKRDSYSRSRGGGSRWLMISCASCHAPILLYQKDGIGKLRRLYWDRITAPQNQIDLVVGTGNCILQCPICEVSLANRMIYKPEKRSAWRLIPGRIRQATTANGSFSDNVNQGD